MEEGLECWAAPASLKYVTWPDTSRGTSAGLLTYSNTAQQAAGARLRHRKISIGDTIFITALPACRNLFATTGNTAVMTVHASNVAVMLSSFPKHFCTIF